MRVRVRVGVGGSKAVSKSFSSPWMVPDIRSICACSRGGQ